MRIPRAETANMYSTLMDTTESDILLTDENQMNENLIDAISEEPSDGFSLSDQQKLVILIIAVSLFFVTLLTTLCIVSPCCYISKLIKKLQIKTTDQKLASASNPIFKQYISPETKSFQLTVVPQFVEKQKLNLNLSKNDKQLNLLNQQSQNEPINLYNNEPTNLKRKLLRDIFQSKEINCNTFFMNNKNLDFEDAYEKWTSADGLKCENNNLIYGLNGLSNGMSNGPAGNGQQPTGKEGDQIEIICSLRTEKVASPANKASNLRLALHLRQIKHLPLKANGLEPAFYCLITGQGGNSAFRKAANRKLSAKLNSLLYYQSETFKPRTLNPTINLKYYSEELSKSVLKDAKLQLRVMAVEKHANDTCLGECVIHLKQVLSDEKSIEKNTFNEKEDVFKCYKLQRPKEIRGELLLSICWLPTSRRATFAFSKANLNNQLNIIDFNQNYFIRVIMCCNGKVIKKKKTCSSTKLDWQENETLTFDLTNLNEYQLEQLCFLVVLVCTQETITEQNVSSPSSPDSPIDGQNGYHGFIKPNSANTMEALKGKVDRSLAKKDNTPIGHFVLTSELWNQVTHEPRKQIKRWVKLI